MDTPKRGRPGRPGREPEPPLRWVSGPSPVAHGYWRVRWAEVDGRTHDRQFTARLAADEFAETARAMVDKAAVSAPVAAPAAVVPEGEGATWWATLLRTITEQYMRATDPGEAEALRVRVATVANASRSVKALMSIADFEKRLLSVEKAQQIIRAKESHGMGQRGASTPSGGAVPAGEPVR